MPKSLPALLVLLAFLCTPLRAEDQPAPKKIIALYLGYEGDQNKPYAPVFVSTVKDSDPVVKKWIKDQHIPLQRCIPAMITAAEMETVMALVKKPGANAARLFNTYHVFCLDADGNATDFLLAQPLIHPLFLSIAKCNIPQGASEELQGAANRFPN